MEFSKSKIPSYNNATALIRDVLPKIKLWQNIKVGDILQISSLIVQTIKERNGFLMDHNLKIFIQPFSDQCQTLITVQHIFEALGLKKKEDVDIMVKYFIPYIDCKQCRESKKVQTDKDENEESGQDCIEAVSRRLSMQLAQMSQVTKDNFLDDDTTSFRIISGEVEIGEMEEQIQEETEDQRQSIPSICKIPGHYPVIHVYHVTKALKEFVVNLNDDKRWEELASFDESSMKKINVSRFLSKIDVESYWGRIPEVFPERKRLLWKSLLLQIKDYYRILLRRSHLQHETKKLQRQSMELRRLLMRYLQQEHARERGNQQ